MSCFTKFIGLSAVCVPVILLGMSIYEPTWSAMDGMVTGVDADNVQETQHALFQMGLLRNKELIATEANVLYESNQYNWCSNEALPLPEATQKLLCILLTSVRGLTVGAVALALVVASFMTLTFFGCAKPTSVPSVAGFSGFLSLLCGLATGAAVGCWYVLSTRLQEALHQSIEGVPVLNIPFGRAFTFVAASAACSIVVSVMLFKHMNAKRAELAKSKKDEVLRNDILGKMEEEKKEKERKAIEKEVYSKFGKEYPMTSP